MPAYVIQRIMEKRGRLAVFDAFDPAETALLNIDMQRFYVGEIPSVVGIIPNINRLSARMRDLGGLVVWLGMTAGAAGESRWHVYHDNFFTPAKGANHRDQLSPGHPGHEFHPASIFGPAMKSCTIRASAPFVRRVEHRGRAASAPDPQPHHYRHGHQHVLRIERATR